MEAGAKRKEDKEEMDVELRAKLEQEFRDQVVETIENFLTAPRDDIIDEYMKDDFSITELEGTKLEFKKAMYEAKMINKFGKVSD